MDNGRLTTEVIIMHCRAACFLKLKYYVVLYSLGGLQEISVCSFDHFENCGNVDRSLSASRWAIVAEDYIMFSTSELLCCKLNDKLSGFDQFMSDWLKPKTKLRFSGIETMLKSAPLGLVYFSYLQRSISSGTSVSRGTIPALQFLNHCRESPLYLL